MGPDGSTLAQLTAARVGGGTSVNARSSAPQEEEMIRINRAIVCGVLLAGLVGPAVQSSARADEVPATNPLSGNEAAIREGRSWFRNVCSVCHGGKADGGGDRGTAADLRVFNKGFRRFMQIVNEGKNTGRTMTMPAWRGVLSVETIYQIGAYLETLALPAANWKEVSNRTLERRSSNIFESPREC